jgi:hypothetical protein
MGISSADDDGQAVVETFDETSDRTAIRCSLSIQTRIDDGSWSSKFAVYPQKGQSVALRVNRGGDKIRWYMIFADLTRNYKNANHPWEDNPYKWVGFEPIQYHRIELEQFNDQREIQPFAADVDLWEIPLKWFRSNGYTGYALDFYHGNTGTFWFQVEVENRGIVTRSPGIEDVNERGLKKNVTRVSIRDGRGFMGYLTSLFNVPGIFGSVLSQSSNYVGADCADMLITAWSKWKRRAPKKNYNVQMLVNKFERRAGFQMVQGMPDSPVTWTEDVRAGDFIAVSYGEGSRRFHHIGALYEDANANGSLDADDLVLHAGPDPLHLTRLKHGAFDGRVVILRP